jgi:hypothetical protein
LLKNIQTVILIKNIPFSKGILLTLGWLGQQGMWRRVFVTLYMFPRLYKTKCILVDEPLPNYKFLGCKKDDIWAAGQPNQVVIGEVSLFYEGTTFRWKVGSCVMKDKAFSQDSVKYLGYVKKCLVFLKEHNAIIIDLEMCGSDKVLHAFSIEWMLDAFMEGKVFCYTERSEFLVAGDYTALA